MSVQATTWVWEHSESRGTSRLVLLAIADAANREGKQSFQSAASIARMTGASMRSVWRAIDELVDLGELAKAGKHGQYQTTVYELPGVPTGQGVKMARRATGDTDAMPNGTDAVPPIGTQPHIDPKESNPKRATRISESFAPSKEHLEWASKETPLVDVRLETAQFIDHHIAKGSTMKDWGRAWQTWMRNQQKWAKPKQHATASHLDPSNW